MAQGMHCSLRMNGKHNQEYSMSHQHDDYIMIDSLIRLADDLERTHPGQSVTLRQVAEYMERRLVKIEDRRP